MPDSASMPRGSQWLANLAAQTLPFIVFALTAPTVVHFSGPESFGALMMFSLAPQIAAQLDLGLATGATLGLTRAITHRAPAATRRLMLELIVASTGLSVVWAALVIAVGPKVLGALRIDQAHGVSGTLAALPALGLWTAAAVASVAVTAPLRAGEQFRSLARVQAVTGVVLWVGIATIAVRGGGLAAFTWWGAITSVAALGWVGWLARRTLEVHRSDAAEVPQGDLTGLRLRDHARAAIGAFVAQATSLATYHADKLAVSALVSPEAAGAYAVCANLANKLLTVTSAVSVFVFPRAARLHGEASGDALREIFVHATRVGVLAAAVLAVPMIALAQPLLAAWMGAPFSVRYAAVLQLLALGYLFAAFSPVASNVAAGGGRTDLNASFAMLGAVLTVGFVVLLAPKLGASGAAMASCLGMSQAIAFNSVVGARVVRGNTSTARAPFFARLMLNALIVGVPTYLLGMAIASAGVSRVLGFTLIAIVGSTASVAFGALWFTLPFSSRSERDVARHYLRLILRK